MSENGKRKTVRRALARAEAEKLATLVRRQGAQALAALIGIHPQTVTTLACGVEANHSTVTLVEGWLAKHV